MSKKKHPEHVNHERWLVSYADFITLLFAFFVVLFASGQSDKHKQAALAKAMQTAFSNQGIFDSHSATPPLTEEATAPAQAKPTPLALPLPSALLDDPLEQGKLEVKMQQQIQKMIEDMVAKKEVGEGVLSVHAAPEGVVVSLREGGFFPSGSAEVRPEAIAVFNQLATSLPHQPMRVEGHTDNVPIHTAQFATNWELSTARAASITRLLIGQNTVQPSEISAAGYAEYHPAASNASEDGRAKNRRVDIIMLRPFAPSPQVP